MRYASVKEFLNDINRFRESTLFADPVSRIAIERLLEFYNRVGEFTREPHPWAASRVDRDKWAADPTKQVPAPLLDPKVNLTDPKQLANFQMTFASAKGEVKKAIERATEAGTWTKINALKHMSQIDKFNPDIKSVETPEGEWTTKPVQEVAGDFLEWIFTTAAKFDENAQREKSRQAREQARLERSRLRDKSLQTREWLQTQDAERSYDEVERVLDLIEEHVDERFKTAFTGYKNRTLEAILTALDQKDFKRIQEIVLEVMGKKFAGPAGQVLFAKDFVTAQIVSRLVTLADGLDSKGFIKEANVVDDIVNKIRSKIFPASKEAPKQMNYTVMPGELAEIKKAVHENDDKKLTAAIDELVRMRILKFSISLGFI